MSSWQMLKIQISILGFWAGIRAWAGIEWLLLNTRQTDKIYAELEEAAREIEAEPTGKEQG